MSEKEQKRSAAYEKAWSAFQELGVEERAAFLVEATAATLGHGLEKAGRSLAHALEDLFRAAEAPCGDGESKESETSEPKASAKKTTRKRATKKTPPKTSEDDTAS